MFAPPSPPPSDTMMRALIEIQDAETRLQALKFTISQAAPQYAPLLLWKETALAALAAQIAATHAPPTPGIAAPPGLTVGAPTTAPAAPLVGTQPQSLRPPATDLSEGTNEYILLVEVPGATRETVTVSPGPVAGTLSVKSEARIENKEHHMLRSERGAHEGKVIFDRVIPVSWDAEVTAARVDVANGILTVTVPKRAGLRPESKREVV